MLAVSALAALVATSPFGADWATFKARFGKSYPTQTEEIFRFDIFTENMKRAAELQAGNPEATFGITKFSDLSASEFKKYYLGYKSIDRTYMEIAETRPWINSTCTDDKCDWQAQGVVARVRDQGQCGSCWAFSTVEQVASDSVLAGNPLEMLAPQQLVDCEKPDQGCNGGDPLNAYPYIIKVGGLEAETSYPYTAVTGTCKFKADKIATSIESFKLVIPQCSVGDCKNQTTMEPDVLNYVKTSGPASICVDAEPWQTYTGGVLSNPTTCSGAARKLDHCVQLAGYNTKAAGSMYWTVRNSWGLDWGEDGYIWIKTGANICGILDEVTVSTVKPKA